MTGVWLGVDVGTVRVGVARCDAAGILATPLLTLARDPAEHRDVAAVAALVAEHGAAGVVIGLPITLTGQEGRSAQLAREYGGALAALIAPVPVCYVDERLTTVTAQRKLAQGGLRGSRAKRAVVDQVAAVELLQQWLDSNSG